MLRFFSCLVFITMASVTIVVPMTLKKIECIKTIEIDETDRLAFLEPKANRYLFIIKSESILDRYKSVSIFFRCNIDVWDTSSWKLIKTVTNCRYTGFWSFSDTDHNEVCSSPARRFAELWERDNGLEGQGTLGKDAYFSINSDDRCIVDIKGLEGGGFETIKHASHIYGIHVLPDSNTLITTTKDSINVWQLFFEAESKL